MTDLCEYQIIRSNENKCIAENQDTHVCLNMLKTKCPIYRLKQENIAERYKCKLIFEYIEQDLEDIEEYAVMLDENNWGLLDWKIIEKVRVIQQRFKEIIKEVNND